jgi:hypothetical protein
MSTPDELQRLNDSVVAAFETHHRATGRKDQWGNEYRYNARVHLRAATEPQRAYYDVFFVTE